jgi:hypothetical protein
MLQGLPFIIGALMLDGLQMFITLSMAGVSSVAGTFVALIPVVGTAAGAGVSVMGFVMGNIVAVLFSLSFGIFFVALLMLAGMFYPRVGIATGLTELILPFFPGWTMLAIRCIYNKHKAKKHASA